MNPGSRNVEGSGVRTRKMVTFPSICLLFQGRKRNLFTDNVAEGAQISRYAA